MTTDSAPGSAAGIPSAASRPPIVLASGSPVRAELLRRARVAFEVEPPRVDEAAVKASLAAEGHGARETADALAEIKACRVSQRRPEAVVIGADQVLECDGALLPSPESREAAREHLLRLRGRSHRLCSAAVIAEAGRPTWRHVGLAELRMREFSETWLDGYLDRNWPALRGCVGGYQIENEGIRLFSEVWGDYFTILGIPLLQVLNHLVRRGILEG